MITEGYMLHADAFSGEDEVSTIIRVVQDFRKSHPFFMFNTCLVSEFTFNSGATNIRGVTIVPYRIPKGHFWFILSDECGETDGN